MTEQPAIALLRVLASDCEATTYPTNLPSKPENWGKPILQVNSHQNGSSLVVQRGGIRRTQGMRMSLWLGQELLFEASSVPMSEKREARGPVPNNKYDQRTMSAFFTQTFSKTSETNSF